MRRYLLVAAAILAVTPMAHAQESEAVQRQAPEQGAESGGAPPVRMAIPRSEAPRPAPEARMPMPRVQQPAPESAQAPRVAVPRLERAPAPQTPTTATAAAADDQRRAVPRTRDRGDNAPVGQAVPRGQVRRDPTPPPPPSGDPSWRAGGRTYSTRPQVYNNYFYSYPYYTYPQRYYPYGYGAFGLGYFYYNPYAWYPRYYGYSGYSGYGYSGYGYSTYGSPGYYNNRSYSVFDIGELRLQVSPRYAQVFIDGYYAGEVDDYDGLFQGIKLESGSYHVELVAPGYETLAFDIRITPGQKITYRGDLRRLP